MNAGGSSARRTRLLAAVAGVVAAAVGLAAAEVVAAVIRPASAPLLVVGEAFIDITPAWLKDAAIAAFGTADKAALLAGMVVTVVVVAAVAGVAGLHRRAAGTAVILLAGAVGAAAALTGPGAGPFDVVPSLVGAGVAGAALHRLLTALRPRVAAAGPPEAPVPGRRPFLVAVSTVAASAAVLAVVGRVLGRSARDVAGEREQLALPGAGRDVPPGADLDIDGLAAWRTPAADFYRIDTALAVPRVSPRDWSLRVHGLVDREVRVSFDDLLAGNLVERWVTLACVSNPVGGDLVGNASWLGVPLREVLRRAGPLPGADMVLSTGADGFTASTPLEVLTRDDGPLLAVAMNGKPLPLEHGFPVRMVVPGLYGYVSATKWVSDLEVTRFADRTAYWTDRGWAERAPVKTSSRIDVPRPFARVQAGRVTVAGVAWAQTRGIAAVEVRVDDGPWRPARLAQQVDVDAWRQWVLDWDAEPGQHSLQVRATDGDGRLQAGERADVLPDGATGWHEVTVRVA